MKPETKVALKIAAIQMAMDGRRDGDDLSFAYEQGQAIYEWLLEELPDDANVGNVTPMRLV